MKVNVTVDCTPEEARAFMGLPDVRPLQAAMMGEIEERMKTAMRSMDPEQLLKTWFGGAAPGLDQVAEILVAVRTRRQHADAVI